MTKYAISPEGAEALRSLSAEILTVANEIVESCEITVNTIKSLGDRLGIYEDSIREIVTKATSSLMERKDYIYYLSDRALRTADEIEEMMGLDTPSSGIASSAGAAVTANQLLGARLVAEGYCDKVDFGKLDNQTAAEMAAAVIETKEQFPNLDLRFIGSTQARNAHIEEDLKDMYMSAYKQLNPGVPDEDLLPFVESRIERDGRAFLKELQPSDCVIAQSLSVGYANGSMEECLLGQYRGISVSEKLAPSYETWPATSRRAVAEGWQPQNCDTPKATMDHELGHQIAKMTSAHDDSYIRTLYDNFSVLDEEGKSSVLSGYAGTDIHEFIAESWSEYRNNPQCRTCAREVSQRMIDLYNSSTYQKVYRR